MYDRLGVPYLNTSSINRRLGWKRVMGAPRSTYNIRPSCVPNSLYHPFKSHSKCNHSQRQRSAPLHTSCSARVYTQLASSLRWLSAIDKL